MSSTVTRELSSPSLLQNLQESIIETYKPSTCTAKTHTEPIINVPRTPKVIRPYPTVVRNKKTNKGIKPGKSSIHKYTSEKNELLDRQQKELKK